MNILIAFYGLFSIISKRATCSTAISICSYGQHNLISTSRGALGGVNNDLKAKHYSFLGTKVGCDRANSLCKNQEYISALKSCFGIHR